MKTEILIVDDDRDFVGELRETLEGEFSLTCAYSVPDFEKVFKPHLFDLLLLDIRLKEGKEGISLLKSVKKEDPELPVIMMTAYPDVDSAVEALKLGAKDYVQKEKIDISALIKIVKAVIKETNLERKLRYLEKKIENLEPEEIVGESKAIKKVKEKARIAGENGDLTVLITGETGTGKELLANYIHKIGVRKDGPFIPVLIGGLHRGSLHSDLFGHEKGAFTGAVERRKGVIEEAHKGILFMDEIGELDTTSQVKLLRVLENRTFTRMGGNREITVDVQFITATNRDLRKMVDEGKFREDLYFRLKGFPIEIPPLRERKEDIPILTEYFLLKLRKSGRTTAEKIHSEVMEVFLRYSWPGNVRELKNVVEFASAIARSSNTKEITLKELPPDFGGLEKRRPLSLERNYEKYLAMSELNLIQEEMTKCRMKKIMVAERLGYPNRFTFQRRVRRIFGKFPELKDEYPEIIQWFRL